MVQVVLNRDYVDHNHGALNTRPRSRQFGLAPSANSSGTASVSGGFKETISINTNFLFGFGSIPNFMKCFFCPFFQEYKVRTWLVNRRHRHTRLKSLGKGGKIYWPNRFYQEA